MITALYNKDVLRLAASIPHLERIKEPSATVERRSPLCGSSVVVDVRIDEYGRVTKIGLEVHACALGQASACLMASNAVGKSVAELESAREHLAAFLARTTEEAGAWPGLEIFLPARQYPSRHRAILLPFEAVAQAAADGLFRSQTAT